MLTHWIWLQMLPALATRQKLALLSYFGDPEELYEANTGIYQSVTNFTSVQLQALEEKDLTKAREIAALCAQKRIGVITYGDSGYPAKLKNIPDPPLVLYYRGYLPNWEGMPAIGVVGTRKATTYGLRIAANMGAQLAACGGLVVSGGASGIDTAAMEQALAQGKPVVGVLGSGVDVMFPAANRELFDKVAEKGCLLSEYPPQTPAYRWHFPQRNRIISGISHGVLVVEAPEISGALITARYALEQGREVYVVPGNVDSSSCAGSNQLLREGAVAVFEGYDVLREYASRFAGQIHRVSVQPILFQQVQIPKAESPKAKKAAKKAIDNRKDTHYSVINSEKPNLTTEQAALVAHLTREPMAVDVLIERSGLPAAKVMSMLTVLALKGVVLNLPGRTVSLK